MVRPTLKNVQEQGEMFQTYRWDIDFTNLPTEVLVGITAEQLNFTCLTTGMPKWTVTSSEVRVRGHKSKQANTFDYESTIPLQFIEPTQSQAANRLIENWRALLWGGGVAANYLEGKMVPPDQYKGILKLRRLDGLDNTKAEYEMGGVYIEDHDPGTLDETGGDNLKPNVTLSYDSFAPITFT